MSDFHSRISLIANKFLVHEKCSDVIFALQSPSTQFLFNMKILTDQVQKFEVHLVFLIFADENFVGGKRKP